MCTAITYKTRDHYFGRNLDVEFSYNETVTVTPRNYGFNFRKVEPLINHYAIIGMAYVVDNYPLYYDATNEKGLSMAGLNFPQNADYKPQMPEKDNVSPFEFIPWILGQCANIDEVREKLSQINLVNISYSRELPLTPLHWIISDRENSVTVESVKDGLKIYDNQVGVLTNNPTFDYHMINLSNYMGLSRSVPDNRFASGLSLKPYSRGMGAMGMPGDLSSASRFVRAVFTRMNSVSGESEKESVAQFFHILGAVEQQRGCVELEEGVFELTSYTSCCNTNKGIYYYRTYENSRITAVDMYREDLDGEMLVSYPIIRNQQIVMQN